LAMLKRGISKSNGSDTITYIVKCLSHCMYGRR
jgi:hypothetical protein